MKNYISIILLILSSFLILTACSGVDLSSTLSDTISSKQTESLANDSEKESENLSEAETESSLQESDITLKTKNFIMNGQGDKSEAEKIKWSESFLNQVDINAIYQEYLSADGKADDIEDFALYLTQNAPIPDNWKELFELDFKNAYNEKVTRYEHIQDAWYQVYVEIDGIEVPYVAVSARTGYYHG